MTDMMDIYEAVGWKRSNDGKSITSTGAPPRPFKIELLVIPIGYNTGDGPVDEVVLAVVLDDEVEFESTILGSRINTTRYTAEFQIPVSQVKIIKE